MSIKTTSFYLSNDQVRDAATSAIATLKSELDELLPQFNEFKEKIAADDTDSINSDVYFEVSRSVTTNRAIVAFLETTLNACAFADTLNETDGFDGWDLCVEDLILLGLIEEVKA